MKLLLTGDSHVSALRGGLVWLNNRKDPLAARHDISIWPLGGGYGLVNSFFQDNGRHIEITDPHYRKNFTHLPPDNGIDCVGISGPFNTTRLWSKDWSGHTPWNLAAEGVKVSSALVNHLIETDTRHLIEFVAVLKRYVPVFVLDAPYPFKAHPLAASESGRRKIVYLHRAHHAHVAKALAGRGIPYLEMDPDWIDEDGFMKPEYQKADFATDPYHGGPVYGLAMMERVICFAEGLVLARPIARTTPAPTISDNP